MTGFGAGNWLCADIVMGCYYCSTKYYGNRAVVAGNPIASYEAATRASRFYLNKRLAQKTSMCLAQSAAQDQFQEVEGGGLEGGEGRGGGVKLMTGMGAQWCVAPANRVTRVRGHTACK